MKDTTVTRTPGPPNVYTRKGGSGSPTLLLLHGLGATGDVWTGVTALLEQRWPGSWMVPDLPGHGRSGRLERYTYSTMAHAIADALDVREPLCIMGHSLGGVLAMMLASGEFGIDVRSVCALSVKPDDWPEEALSAAVAIAAMPHQSFATKSEAIDHVLTSLGEIDDLTAWSAEAHTWWASSVHEDDGRWAPAMDQRVYAVGPHKMDELLARCRADLLLAAGTMDPLCPPDALRSLHPNVVLLDGEGHSPHVRDANTMWPLLQHLLDGSCKVTVGQRIMDAAAWVREHYATGTDPLSVDGFVRDLADDVQMVSAAGELSGLPAVRDSARTLFSVLSGLQHEIHTVAMPSRNTIVVDATVTYWFLSGEQTSLPAVTTFQMRDGQVAHIHLDMDIAALWRVT